MSTHVTAVIPAVRRRYPASRAVARRIQELHEPHPHTGYCRECGFRWPCLTARIAGVDTTEDR